MHKSLRLFLLASFCLIVLLAYILLYYNFDTNIEGSVERIKIKLYENDSTRSLINGSGINNIPKVKLTSTNREVLRAKECGDDPIYFGRTGTDADCVRSCASVSAKSIHVNDGETVTFNQFALQPGVHCTLGVRPECNMKTSVALITINSVTCRSKFPRLFGGPLGSTVVACNNSRINDPHNILWDYLENRRVDPWRSNVISEDEILPDGSYRYSCKLLGLDSRGNKYIEHPHDRFHPISNYCADLVHSSGEYARTVFSIDAQSFICDCGDATKTRLMNIVANDPSSQCSNEVYSVTRDVKKRYRVTVPYKCVTVFSNLSDVGRYPICPNEKITRHDSQMASVYLEYTSSESELIEHPLYEDFSINNSGVHSPKYIQI